MPFEAAGFPQRRDPPDRRDDTAPARPSDGAICTIIVVLFAVLMFTPISLVVLVDIVRYVRGG